MPYRGFGGAPELEKVQYSGGVWKVQLYFCNQIILTQRGIQATE